MPETAKANKEKNTRNPNKSVMIHFPRKIKQVGPPESLKIVVRLGNTRQLR
jgi:hypothetical protein